MELPQEYGPVRQQVSTREEKKKAGRCVFHVGVYFAAYIRFFCDFLVGVLINHMDRTSTIWAFAAGIFGPDWDSAICVRPSRDSASMYGDGPLYGIFLRFFLFLL